MISVLMPSIREDLVKQRIEEFSSSACELIVVSPFEVRGRNVVWVKEEFPLGTVQATNLAYKHAKGDYICYLSDCSFVPEDSLLKMKDFVTDNMIGAFKIINDGINAPQWAINGKMYACWGMIKRSTIEALDGLFDERYKGYYADPDLAMRLWDAGRQVS